MHTLLNNLAMSCHCPSGAPFLYPANEVNSLSPVLAGSLSLCSGCRRGVLGPGVSRATQTWNEGELPIPFTWRAEDVQREE